MRVWYREAVYHAPTPARVKIKQITVELMKIYCAVPYPQGEHPHVRDAFPRKQLSTYEGGGRVGYGDTTGTQVGKTLPDEI